MKAIFKRELYSYFVTAYGYVFLSSFLFLAGIISYLANVVAKNAHFSETTLSALHLILIPLIPLITMKTFTDDKKQNTEQLLYSSFTRTWELVLGKFLACGCLLFAALALTILYPLVFSLYSPMNWGHIFGTYLGIIFIGSLYIAIGLFISIHSDNQALVALVTLLTLIVILVIDNLANRLPQGLSSGLIFIALIAFAIVLWFYLGTHNLIISAVLACFLLFLIGLGMLIDQQIFVGLISKTSSWLSPISRFSSFSQGLLRVQDIFYYLSFIALLLFHTSLYREQSVL